LLNGSGIPPDIFRNRPVCGRTGKNRAMSHFQDKIVCRDFAPTATAKLRHHREMLRIPKLYPVVPVRFHQQMTEISVWKRNQARRSCHHC
jgi:hypothetical protein